LGGRIFHRFRDTVTYSFKHSIHNRGQTAAAYRKLPPPYPMAPLQTFYDLPFSHNTARLALHIAL